MFRLRDFRFDHQIDAVEIFVAFDDPGVEQDDAEVHTMTLESAIGIAVSRGLHVIQSDDNPEHCHLGPVRQPIEWEQVDPRDRSDPPAYDERLWFDAQCGSRDYLLEGNPHTFHGRMYAWCPGERVEYRVSLNEMGSMSDEARYFVRGFLSGNQPDPPEFEDNLPIDQNDFTAWLVATERFRRLGSWRMHRQTCRLCGRVLIPGGELDRCESTCSA